MTHTKADIIRMASEVGLEWARFEYEGTNQLLDFLNIALAAERAARQAAQSENADLKERLARSGVEMRKAVRDEREACANICDELDAEVDKYPAACATAIRARGQADTNTKGTHE